MNIRFYFIIFICLQLFCPLLYAHGWKAPNNAANFKNPIPFTDTSKNAGKKIYLDNCASCHGDTAIGLKKVDTGLSMDTPDLIKRLINHSEGDFFWKIQNGRGSMPSFKGDLSDKEIWDTINFIKGLSSQ